MSAFPRAPATSHGTQHRAAGSDPIPAQTTGGQDAVADLNLGALVLLTDAITALGTVQTRFNALLSELRSAGVIAGA